MDEFQEQIQKLCDSWDRAYEVAKPNSATWQPYLPGSQLVMVDEAVRTLKGWVARTRAPTGLTPTYHLAKTVAGTQLASLLAIAQQLEAGTYAQLPNFVSGLLSLLGAVHTMSIFASKDTVDTYSVDMSAQLSESIAVMHTARRELADKVQELDRVGTLAQAIITASDRVSELADGAETALGEARVHRDAAGSTAEEAKRHTAALDELIRQARDVVTTNAEASSNMAVIGQDLVALERKSKQQQEIIDSILPKGASAGLAAAFASRGRGLEITKWIWVGAFGLALIGLVYLASLLLKITATPDEYWRSVFYRLPLASPLIWLGWFSAIQYGNTIRVQEDYAFKEATSKAFQGYRDHLQYLGQVDTTDGVSAANLLAVKTIEILAREPLRIYKGSDHDASPARGLAALFSRDRASEATPVASVPDSKRDSIK